MSCLSVLKEKGLKITPQRRLIVDIIHESDEHLSVEDIITFVQKKMPEVCKSTIYRTLDVLEEAGCVYKSQSGDHSIYHPSAEGHHHHLVCRKCGKTMDCNEDLFSPVKRSLAKQYGFQTDFRHMVIKGICQRCERNAGNENIPGNKS